MAHHQLVESNDFSHHKIIEDGVMVESENCIFSHDYIEKERNQPVALFSFWGMC